MPASYTWFLALRYLLTRAIHGVALFGTALAVWALIVVIAVFSGMVQEIHDHVRGSTPEILIQDIDPPRSYAELRRIVEADAAVVATAPRLSLVGLYFPRTLTRRVGANATTSLEQRPADYNFAIFVGVDPERERATTPFPNWLGGSDLDRVPPSVRCEDPDAPLHVSADRVEQAARFTRTWSDEWDSAEPSERGCLLGLGRLLSSGVVPGQRLDVLGASRDFKAGKSSVVSLSFYAHVAGAFTTPYRAVETAYAFVPIETVRVALGYDPHRLSALDKPLDAVSEVAVRAKPGTDLDALARRIEHGLGDAIPCRVLTWKKQHETYLSAVEHERALMKFVLFVVLLVSAFMIYAMLHMMVMQKWKDVGILTALGATPRGIATIFLLCGLIVAGTGALLGTLLGVWSAKRVDDIDQWFANHFHVSLFPRDIYVISKIPYSLEVGWIAQVVLFAVVLALIVSWLPARRAARLSPVEALSYE